MTFLAGVIALDRSALSPGLRESFHQALDRIRARLPRPPQLLSRPHALLARSGFGRLWQGPAFLSSQALDAAAIGVQWRRTEAWDTALTALAEALVTGRDPARMAFGFDGFACAAVPGDDRPPVLATDPLGLFSPAYAVRGTSLVFSSHQGFLRFLLGPEVQPDLQAVLEFLIIGHALGDKTLISGVGLIPPGTRLVCEAGGVRAEPYADPGGGKAAERPVSVRAAAERLFDHLVFKRDSYADLCNDPVLGFLSGGWDSRLLTALFAGTGRIAGTLTTQQRVRLGPRFVSEERIAAEVAHLLGLGNRFVPPSYRDPSNLPSRAARLDWTTWFHDWSFHMADEVPQGSCLLLDGLMGDVLLRALFVDDELAAAQKAGDRKAAQRALHRRCLQGFNTYTPGVETWGRVLHADLIRSFTERLREDVGAELENIDHEEFTTLFFLRNRSRRGIAPLPRLVFGERGDVHLPFCDPEFVRLVLSCPIEWRRDGSLYRHLLERARPGLSRIPSTNDRDLRVMGPFLTEDLPAESLSGQQERRRARLRSLCDAPPRTLTSLLRPEIRAALDRKDEAALSPHLPLLEKVLMLEGLYEPPDAHDPAHA